MQVSFPLLGTDKNGAEASKCCWKLQVMLIEDVVLKPPSLFLHWFAGLFLTL